MLSNDLISLPAGDLQAAAVRLGVWDEIASRQVLAAWGLDRAWHGINQRHHSKHPLQSHVPVSRMSLGNLIGLSGTLCACFLADFAWDHEELALDFFQERTKKEDLPEGWSLVFPRPFQHSLTMFAALAARFQTHQDELTQDLSVEGFLTAWKLVRECADSWGSPLEVSQVDVSEGVVTPGDEERLREVAARVRSLWVEPTRALLVSPEVCVPVASLAREEWISRSYLTHLDLEEDTVLLGVFQEDLLEKELDSTTPYAPAEFIAPMVAFFLASLLHGGRGEGASFFRVPRFAHDFLITHWHQRGLKVQKVPDPGDLDWAELAGLWDPREESTLCSLSRAVETLRLV